MPRGGCTEVPGRTIWGTDLRVFYREKRQGINGSGRLPAATVSLPVLIDFVALLTYLAVTIGYHWFYIVLEHRSKTTSLRMRLREHRRNWVELVIKRGERIMAVQTLRNSIMTNTFLASTMILLVAFFTNFLVMSDQGSQILFHEEPSLYAGATSTQVKGTLLVALYAVAFIMFMSNLRGLNHLSTLISVDPEHLRATERQDPIVYLTAQLNRVGSQTTFGHRAVYFSMPVLGWLFSPWIFLSLTVLAWFYLMVSQDFARPLERTVPEDEPSPAPGASPTTK